LVFGALDRQSRVRLLQRPLDADLAAAEINVTPAKRSDFTPPHARRQTHYGHRVEWPAAQSVKKRLNLIGRKDLDFSALHARRLGRGNRIAGDYPPFDGMAEDAMQESVSMPDGARRSAGTLRLWAEKGFVSQRTAVASELGRRDGTVNKPAFARVSTVSRGYQMSDSHH